jgi:hypothetical protein
MAPAPFRRLLLPLAIIVTLACAQQAAAAFSWSACTPDSSEGGGGDAAPPLLTPSAVTLTPDPPEIGNPVSFGISGTLATPVEGGTVDGGTIGLRVKFEGVELYEEEGPLCEKIEGGCPAGGGDGSGGAKIEYQQDLPPIAPPGHYQVRVIGTTGASTREGQAVVCVDVEFDMVMPSAAAGEGAEAAAAAVVV